MAFISYILTVLLISIINAKEIQRDVLKQYEIQYIQKNIDYEFYKITKEFSEKNVTLNFGEILKSDEEILIDIEFRFNSKFTGDEFFPINIRGENGEGFELSFTKTNVKFILPILTIENIQAKTHRYFNGYETEVPLFTDLKWHKVNMSISSEFMEIWLDCNVVFKKFVQREDLLTIQKLFEKNYLVFFSMIDSKEPKFVTLELKKYEITKQKLPDSTDGESCEIPKTTIQKDTTSPLELTPIFGRKYEQNASPTNTDIKQNAPPIDIKTDTIFYRFNNPVERFIRIPESFTEKTDSKNFAFEIIFRHQGNIEGQMTLLQLRNDKDDDLQSVNINSGQIINYIWNSKNGYQDARAIVKNVDVYDGKWHLLQIEITVKKESSTIWQKIRGKDNYSKKIKFILDCVVIGEDTLSDTLPFNTVEQTGVFFKNNLLTSFTDFDVKSLKMKDNYEEAACIKVN